ncbi:hypothetical protein COS79_03380 [Candidatus Woesearchaeota archaeon CG06_land_8_20_14_3_00_33_13]|nr:MAG: hypothetical protein COS79_03380 [Candidatus Woesearchaeota archaeon CG06_land_8_20_14_3_00_33_13]
MKKSKNAKIVIDATLGLAFSIMLFIAILYIVFGLVRPTEESKNSFYNLVNLIKEVNGNNPGTIKSMVLRMDKDTAIIGFPKNKKSIVSSGEIDTGEYGIYKVNNIFNKPSDCEKSESCICLCRHPERQEGRNFICEDENLICETLDGLDLIGDGFIISRSEMPGFTIKSDLISTEDMSQFREVYVEKYSEYGEDLVAVCENLEEVSCVSQEYREEKKAIYSLNNFKNFIELCKDREFVEDEDPCSCGAFNFRSFIPEGYTVEFSNSKNGKLNISLKHETQELGSIEADTNFCVCKLNYELGDDLKISIDHPEKPINLEYNIKDNYVFYYGNYPEEEKPQIAFIKYNKKNICLAYHEFSEKGKGYIIEPYAEPFDTILIPDPSGYFGPKKLVGCKYPATDTEELW